MPRQEFSILLSVPFLHFVSCECTIVQLDSRVLGNRVGCCNLPSLIVFLGGQKLLLICYFSCCQLESSFNLMVFARQNLAESIQSLFLDRCIDSCDFLPLVQ